MWAEKLAIAIIMAAISIVPFSTANAQGVVCDPTKVLTADACAKCHAAEVNVWRGTPHFRTFEELTRNPEAKAICNAMGVRSVKRSGICIDCHFTTQQQGSVAKPVSGISCESCHGASQDWVAVHNDYGGPTATKESETAAHRRERLNLSTELGMKNTQDLYLIATSCYSCHTVPNEKLVNVGGHNAGSVDFELVRWSQGMVRHNFLRTGGTVNAKNPIERLRVMYVVGLIADLEFSTRATAAATEKATFGITVANRAARAAVRLAKVQQDIANEHVQSALNAFADAKLQTNNEASLLKIADEIQLAGRYFVQTVDGATLAAIDKRLPDESEYK